VLEHGGLSSLMRGIVMCDKFCVIIRARARNLRRVRRIGLAGAA
jgi:hypothetical protein